MSISVINRNPRLTPGVVIQLILLYATGSSISVFIGNIDKNYLIGLIEKVEKLINRKVRYLAFQEDENGHDAWFSADKKPLLLWASS